MEQMEAALSVLCGLQLLVHRAAMPPPPCPGANAIRVGSAPCTLHAMIRKARKFLAIVGCASTASHHEQGLPAAQNQRGSLVVRGPPSQEPSLRRPLPYPKRREPLAQDVLVDLKDKAAPAELARIS